MLQVRKNEISLRKWSGDIAQLRTSEGIFSARAFSIAVKLQMTDFRIVVPELLQTTTK